MPKLVRFVKRFFDLMICVPLLFLFAPLFIIIAIAIKLDSRGSIIYKQKRMGLTTEKDTEFFYLYKFRSMVNDAEQATGPVWATDDDPRITRVGRFLRKTRLDELPQLWNVLTGKMSIVGPRPERPHFVTQLDAQIPYYSERVFYVKPGITGLAQINLDYDSDIDSVKQKLYYDHAYAARTSSLLEYLKTESYILFKTLWVMISKKGAK